MIKWALSFTLISVFIHLNTASSSQKQGLKCSTAMSELGNGRAVLLGVGPKPMSLETPELLAVPTIFAALKNHTRYLNTRPDHILSASQKASIKALFDEVADDDLEQAFEKAFIIFVEAQLKLKSGTVATRLRKALNKNVEFIEKDEFSASVWAWPLDRQTIFVEGPYQDIVITRFLIIHELEHLIQGIPNYTQLARGLKEQESDHVDFVNVVAAAYHAEYYAIRAEWEFLHSIPREKLSLLKERLLKRISKNSVKPSNLKNLALENGHLSFHDYLEQERQSGRFDISTYYHLLGKQYEMASKSELDMVLFGIDNRFTGPQCTDLKKIKDAIERVHGWPLLSEPDKRYLIKLITDYTQP